MKKIYIFLAFANIGFTSLLTAQSNCNAGYESPTFSNSLTIPGNIAFAIRVTAASAGTLTDLCLYNSGASNLNIKLAAYDDNAGFPGNLIASTSAIPLTMTAGAVVTPVTPVAIVPGDYYLVGVIDINGSPIPVDNSTSLSLFQMAMSFNSSFPATGSFSTISGNPVNIWMNVTCSPSGIQETVGANALSMEGYPVPTHDIYSMNFQSSKEMNVNVSLYNSNGQILSESEQHLTAGENKMKLSMNGLTAGFYFIRITDETQNVLISKSVVKE